MENSIKFWLNKKININMYEPEIYISKYSIDTYYTKDSYELVNNEINSSEYVQSYKILNNQLESEYKLYINQYTNRYIADMLFRKLIDYCIDNNITNNKNIPLINKEYRNQFYLLCYKNSFRY